MKSKHIIKNHVRFKGEFKKEFKDEFPGRDLAEFIAEQLRQKNYVVNSVEYEEPWFTVNVVSGSIEYPLMVSRSAMEEDYWEISCPRTLKFFARLRGKSEDTEMQSLVNVLDEILQDEKTITDIKWYSDYSDLADDYVQKPVAKRLNVVSKYLEKLFLPLCVTGWILALVGGIRSGKESLLLRIGAIIFLLPIGSYFCLIVLNFLWALIDDIRESYQKGKKKKCLRWFVYLAIIAMIVGPFFLGLLRIPSVDKVMPTIMKYVLRFCILLLFCGILFGLFFGILSDVQKQKERKKKILLVVGLIFILFGATGFFSAFFSALDMLRWIPGNIELPLAGLAGIDVNGEGYLFTASEIYCRIQVYNRDGDFVRGWFLNNTGSIDLKIRINDNNKVEVASLRGSKIDVFDENGKLIKTSKYDEDDTDFFDSFEQKGTHLFEKSTMRHYDVEGWVFPGIIQTGPEGEKKIGKNAVYLFPFQGPFQGLATAFIGGFFITRAEKKRKKKRS